MIVVLTEMNWQLLTVLSCMSGRAVTQHIDLKCTLFRRHANILVTSH